MLCNLLLFVDDLFSVCFQERLCISFSHCSSLDIRLLLMSFLVLFSRSFRRILFFFFGVLFNFLEGFSPLALHLLLLAFFVGLSLFLFILISLEILSPQT